MDKFDEHDFQPRERLLVHEGVLMYDDGSHKPMRPATGLEIERITNEKVARVMGKPDAPSGAGGNPKDGAAAVEGRVPLTLFPHTAIIAGAMAMVEGDAKYGGYNFRATKVAASVYLDAMDRHMKAWANGEDIDDKSGLNHLWKALACVAILIDATECNTLIDDRPPAAPVGEMLERLAPIVREIRERHADKHPLRYTLHNPEGAE